MAQLYPAVTEQITTVQLIQALKVNPEPFTRYLNLVTYIRDFEGKSLPNFRTLPDYCIGITNAFIDTIEVSDPDRQHIYLNRCLKSAKEHLAELEALLASTSREHDYRQALVKRMIEAVHADIPLAFTRAMGKPELAPYVPGQVSSCLYKHRGVFNRMNEDGMPLNPIFSEYNHCFLARKTNRDIYEAGVIDFRAFGISRKYWMEVPTADFLEFYDRVHAMVKRLDYEDVFEDGRRVTNQKHKDRAKDVELWYHKPRDLERTMVTNDFSLQRLTLTEIRFVVTALEKDYANLTKMFQLLDACADIQCHSAFVRSKTKKKPT